MLIQALLFSKVETGPETSSKKRNGRKRKKECTASKNCEGFTLVNSVWKQDESICSFKPIVRADEVNYPPGTKFEMVEVWADVVPLFDSAPAERKQRLYVHEQNLDIVRLLLPDNTNIELITDFKTPDEDLVFYGRNLSVIEKLFQSGVIISYRDGAEISTLAHFAALRKSRTLIPTLQRYGVDLNGVSSGGRTPLHIAIQINSLEMVMVLLNNGANPNVPMTNDGSSPLHLAVRCEFIGAVVVLIENGADVNATNNENQSPLAVASEVNDAVSMDILLKNGVGLSSAATHPEVLARAVKHNAFESVQKLLEHGARADQKHTMDTLFYSNPFSSPKVDETTAIHVACAFADEKMLQLLLDHGADPNVECNGSEDERNHLPISIAVARGAVGIVKLLLKNGVTVCSHPGLLIWAVAQSNISLMKLLLENGCNLNVADLINSYQMVSFFLSLDEDSVEMLMLYESSFTFLEVPLRCFIFVDAEHSFYRFVSYVFTDLKKPIEENVRRILSCIDFDAVDYGDPDYDEEDDHSPSSMIGLCAEILAKHVIKLIVAGKQIDESIIPAEVKDYFHLDVLRAECEDEIELMKSKMVLEAPITFYDVLMKDTDIFSRHLKSENIRQTLVNFQFEEVFRQYGRIIQCRVRRADFRLKCLRNGMKSFTWLVCRLPRLPRELKEEILGLLSIQDLIKLHLCFPSK